MESKKGVLEMILSGTIILGVATMALVLVLTLSQKAVDNIAYKTTFVNITNETNGAINVTGYRVTNATLRNFGQFTIVQARNGSSGLIISAPNYTTNSTGTVFNATAVAFPNVHFDYSFYYDAPTTASDTGNESIYALGTLSNYTELIVIGIVAVVLISLIVGFLAFNRQSGR